MIFKLVFLIFEKVRNLISFDDFKVTQTKGPIVSSQDYYPFGLTFNNYQRENAASNQNLFQEKELLSDLNQNVYDFEWRQYDPAIGRTTSQDPHADYHWDKSPYSFLANNPANVTDPTGADAVLYLIMEHRAYMWTVAKELEMKVNYGGTAALEHINSEIRDLSVQWLLDK